MYNKLFTKILDSSIWLEPIPTRIVWLTLLAAMDEDGVVQFASVLNLAHRARVTPEEAHAAVAVLENPDEHSSDTDHDGRRIERIPGGWLVLNAQKYASVVTRSIARERTRRRVAKHRARKRSGPCNGGVTPSVSVSDHTYTQDQKKEGRDGKDITKRSEGALDLDLGVGKGARDLGAHRQASPKRSEGALDLDLERDFESFWSRYPKKVGKKDAQKAWRTATLPTLLVLMNGLDRSLASDQWTRDAGRFMPHPATWIRGEQWNDVAPSAAPVPVADTPYVRKPMSPAQLAVYERNCKRTFIDMDLTNWLESDNARLAEEAAAAAALKGTT
jgi:hypothetical protein